MKRKTLVIALFFLLFSFGGCDLFTQWKEIKSSDGRCSIQMPGNPKYQEMKLKANLPDMKVKMTDIYVTTHIYLLGKPNSIDTFSYILSYVDYPNDLLLTMTYDQFFDNGKQGVLAALQGKLVSEKPITINGNPGREFKFTAYAGKAFVQGRFYLVKNRLYQMMIFIPKNLEKSKDIDRFLNSFRLF